jgi:hypothetical protein
MKLWRDLECEEDDKIESYPPMMLKYVKKHNLKRGGPHGVEVFWRRYDTRKLKKWQVQRVEKAATVDTFNFKK